MPPVPSSMTDLSTTASSNSPAGSDNLNTADDFFRAIQAIIKAETSTGAAITAASTITPDASGKYYVVSGSTTITAIGSTNSWNGRIIVLKFSSTPQLTHNGSTFILPTSANLTMAAGDVAGFVQESSGVWRCIYLQRAAGSVTIGAVTTSGLTQATSKILGRTTASTGAIEEISVTSPLSLSGGALTTSMATSRLIGRTTASTGVMEEISVGTGLSLSAGTLTATGGITQGSVSTTTGGSSIDFTSIPSTVKRITIMFHNVSLSGSDSLLVQIGDSGGIETTSYNGGGARFGAAAVVAATFTTGFGFNNSTAAANLSGSIVLTNLTGNTWAAQGVIGGDSSVFAAVTGGSKTLSATLDRVRITSDGASTFDANGGINILYE